MRPRLFLFNILLTVSVIALLIWDVFPSYFPFMIGTAAALFVNYGFTAKMHKKVINLHAGPALMMCSTLMGAAVLHHAAVTRNASRQPVESLRFINATKSCIQKASNGRSLLEAFFHCASQTIACPSLLLYNRHISDA